MPSVPIRRAACRPTVSQPSRVHPMPVVVLGEQQCLRVVTSKGQPLLEISCDTSGPAIRLVQDSVRIECDGVLDFAAERITLEARDDVTVKGRTIRLN